MLNCYLNKQKGDHDERPEFKPYDHMRVRTKVRLRTNIPKYIHTTYLMENNHKLLKFNLVLLRCYNLIYSVSHGEMATILFSTIPTEMLYLMVMRNRK